MHLFDAQLSLERVWQSNNYESKVKEHDMERQEGCFLAAVLACRRSEDRPDLADQPILCPLPTGLIEEVFHLCRHVAETCGRAKYDGVVVDEIIDVRDRRNLVELVMRGYRYLVRDELGNPLDVDFRARHARAFGLRMGHPLDIARRIGLTWLAPEDTERLREAMATITRAGLIV